MLFSSSNTFLLCELISQLSNKFYVENSLIRAYHKFQQKTYPLQLVTRGAENFASQKNTWKPEGYIYI